MSKAPSPFAIRRLEGDDATTYRQLRLEALERHPDAFGASLENEQQMSIADVADRLARSVVFGAFDGDELEGVAGWYRLGGGKFAHRGALWGMYVRPQLRGRGMGKALVNRVIEDARDEVEQLHLTVTAHNEAARSLYESTGFTSYGVEPRALRIGDAYVDEIMMVCRLRG